MRRDDAQRRSCVSNQSTLWLKRLWLRISAVSMRINFNMAYTIISSKVQTAKRLLDFHGECFIKEIANMPGHIVELYMHPWGIQNKRSA